jgi:hypothetical protein
MNDTRKTILEVFNAAPLEAIPKSKTKANRLLLILADGKEHDRNKLILDPLLGESMRSALQDLRGDKLLNWLIHSGVCGHSGARTIKLDPRHLSGESEQDAAARRERRKQFKEVSAKEATHGRIRESKAIREMTDAQVDYLMSLGDAVNDPTFKK